MAEIATSLLRLRRRVYEILDQGPHGDRRQLGGEPRSSCWSSSISTAGPSWNRVPEPAMPRYAS